MYSNLGTLYAQQQDWEKATEFYQKAIAQDPQFAPAYLNLSKVWKRLGNEEETQKYLIKALTLNPGIGTAEDHYQVAQALEASDNKAGAALFYQQTIQQTSVDSKDINLAEIHQRLANWLEEQGNWQAATEQYQKILQLNKATTSDNLCSYENISESLDMLFARIQAHQAVSQQLRKDTRQTLSDLHQIVTSL